jgi:hypothetical protein
LSLRVLGGEVLVVADDFVDDEAQELLRELGVEMGRLREVSESSDLDLLPSPGSAGGSPASAL